MPHCPSKLLSILSVSVLLVGCGSVPLGDQSRSAELKKFQSKSDVGQVYVCRSSSFFGLAIRPTIELDGKAIADIGRGTFLYAEVTPGDHTVVAKTKEHDSKMPFSIAAGEQKFFQTWISMGFLSGWGLVDAMTTEEGKRCVAEGELAVAEQKKP